MALYRSTLLIGLICAVFTTAGYGVNTNPDGVNGRYGDSMGRGYETADPCLTERNKQNAEYNNAYGNCKDGVWSFVKCKNGATRALHASSRDLSNAKLTVENYCSYPKACEPGWTMQMGTVNGVTGVILLPIYNQRGKIVGRERICTNSREFCNTDAAKAALIGATKIDLRSEKQEELQKLVNEMDRDQLIKFFAEGKYNYDEYCCATECERGYKVINCKCVPEQVEQPAEPKKHKITYECNGGIGCNTCQPTEYTSGTATVVPNPECKPTKTNHKFMGWCINEDLSGSCSDQYTIPAAHYNDVVLYAKWLEDSKPGITYYLHGGTGCPDSSSMPDTYTPGTGATITCQPTRNGYEFSGWCEGNENCDTPTALYVIGTDATGDKEMHAVWKPNAIMRGSVTCTDYAGCGTATVFDKLNPVLSAHFAEKSSSVWKNDEGKFNTARLASDSIAGVVLGTVGGVVTSTVMKKNQVKKGFENIQCTIDSQPVASYGDEFSVGLLQM